MADISKINVNGTVYDIKDETARQSSRGGGITYSYDEVETNDTWVDGKKIYRKTYVDTMSSRTTSYSNEFSCIDLNIDCLINTNISIKTTYVAGGVSYRVINGYLNTNNYASMQYGIGRLGMMSYIKITMAQGTAYLEAGDQVFLTIYYTKRN